MSAAIDYLLYDNRSRASWGRDWGLKAATGALAERQDVQQKFVDYCKLSFETGRNRLADFGWAVGGFRTPDRKGYVLCVTVEVEDRAGRPTVAFVGLYHGDIAVFQRSLAEVDLQATARAILEPDEPPAVCTPRLRGAVDGPEHVGSRELVEDLRRRSPVGFLLAAFQPEESPSAVLGYFQDCAQSFRQPPSNVLGVTSLVRPQELRQSGHTIVYCHPAPGNHMAREALARYLAEQDEKLPQRPTPEPLYEPSLPQGAVWPAPGGGIYPGQRRRPAWSPLLIGLMSLLVVMVLLAAGWALLRPPVPNGQPETTAGELPPSTEGDLPAETQSSDVPIEPPVPLLTSGTDEELLRVIEAQIQRFRDLDPGELGRHRVHQILTEVPLAPAYQARRQFLLRDIEVRLPGVREKFLGLNLEYYFEERGKDFPVADRVNAIRTALAAAELDGAGCQDLEVAFGFAFRSESGPLRRWCAALRDFEALILESRAAR
jgi:hypothetical protein